MHVCRTFFAIVHIMLYLHSKAHTEKLCQKPRQIYIKFQGNTAHFMYSQEAQMMQSHVYQNIWPGLIQSCKKMGNPRVYSLRWFAARKLRRRRFCWSPKTKIDERMLLRGRH